MTLTTSFGEGWRIGLRKKASRSRSVWTLGLFNSSVLADSNRADEKVKNFFDWLEFAQRAVEMGRLAEKCDPRRFLEWLSALGFAGDIQLFEIDSRTGDLELTTEVQKS